MQYVHDQEGGPLYGKLSDCRLLGEADHRLQVEAGRTWNAVGRAHEARLRELARAFFGEQYDLEIKAAEIKPPAKKAAAKKSFQHDGTQTAGPGGLRRRLCLPGEGGT